MTVSALSAHVTPGAVPLTFTVDCGRCFGWFHAAGTPSRGVGIVLCRPIGFEAICAYSSYTQLAEKLAASGFDVMRFDYHGTGDSAGDDSDPGRVKAWIDSITAATHELRRLAGVQVISYFGVRLGATLAVEAAVQSGGVDSLVMWAPCKTGRAFVRELRAANAGRAHADGNAAADHIEALGYVYSSQTLEDLQALRGADGGRPLARRILVLGRDDMPGEGPLPAHYRALGIDTTYAAVPGYAAMMADPREIMLPAATLDLLTGWFFASYPLPAAYETVPVERVAATAKWTHNGLRETALRFGAERLFGILTEPEVPSNDQRQDTAVLLLNVGANYRIGPSRLYVRMARSIAAQGWRALRLDLPGIGDSRVDNPFSMDSLYSRDSTAEVAAAIDCLAARGCKKFFLLGICSGSFVAFQSALADARVTGQILMNSRLLEWQLPDATGGWQSSMQRYYKSTAFYRRSLLSPAVYLRLLRGEVDVAGITGRFCAVMEARLKRMFTEFTRRSFAAESVIAKVRRLAARGTDTLMIIAAQDDGRDYVEYHFGNLGSRMRGHPRFRMVLVDNADHTFSNQASQRFVIDTVLTHLKNLPAVLLADPAPRILPDFRPVETLLPAKLLPEAAPPRALPGRLQT